MTPNVDSANRRSKHDHGSTTGSELADAFRIRAFRRWDVNNHADVLAAATGQRDDVVQHEIVIGVHVSNALSVNGAIGDYAIAAALLERARDAIKAYKIRPGKTLTVPGRDVGMPGCTRLTVEGPVERTDFAVSIIDRVRAELDEQHPVEAEHARANKARIEL